MTAPAIHVPRVEAGDCVEVMRRLAVDGVRVHAVVTDPPYHLTSIVERFGKAGAARARGEGSLGGAYARTSRGFMGQQWDGGDVAFRPETWRAAFDLLPPGGHLLAFSGSRTWHRMAVAIEDAGFEIRDTLAWLYGTGFPKSKNVTVAGAQWGTALKPGFEPVVVARKPLAGTVESNVREHGAGALNIDGCRIASADSWGQRGAQSGGGSVNAFGDGLNNSGRAGSHDGGRWPANVLHDGSPEVEEAFAAFGERPGQQGRASSNPRTAESRRVYGAMGAAEAPPAPRGDAGTASRFFYCAKATRAERAGSAHPTVKPLALMRWLVRLVTPPGGTVLDPFAGTGSTGEAAMLEGFRSVLIEREEAYRGDISRRIERAAATLRSPAATDRAPATDDRQAQLFASEVAP